MNSTLNTKLYQASGLLDFVLKDLTNRRYLLIGIGLCIIQFIIFKLLYPFPDFFGDSYSYIFAASAHLDISIWPIGYSKFLAAFHDLTSSDTALVGFQYFFMQLAVLYFYFTILYFYKASQWTKTILFAFCLINPMTLYLCNTINSDALFGALSLFWLTELIWIIHRPRIYQLFTQATLLFICFTIRNNAYYYPLLSVLAFLLSGYNWKVKTAGVLLPILLIVPFIINTQEAAKKITGTRQYSLFTGWQLANNALYIYDQIEVDSSKLPTPQARELNRLTLSFLKKANSDHYRSELNACVGNYFIKYPEAPLKQYYIHHYPLKSRTQIQLIADWGKASLDFEPFGKTIILQHPTAYLRYFVIPNIMDYFLPPLSHLGLYNYGETDIDHIAKHWFRYPTAKVKCVSSDLQGFLIVYTALFLLFNLYFLWKFILYISRARLTWQEIKERGQFFLMAGFLLFNFCFTISTTVNILRYQYVPMFILLSFGMLISDYLVKTSLSDKTSGLENQSKKASTLTFGS